MEDDPEKALEKLLTIKDLVKNERLVYVRHLAELLELIGEAGL